MRAIPMRCRKPRYDGSGIIKESYHEDEYFYTGSNLEVLAFFEYASYHRLPIKSRVPKLISHFNKHLHLTFSEKEIEAKLMLFWERGSPAGSARSGWPEIIARGISALRRLPQEKIDRVHKRARELEAVFAHDHNPRGLRRISRPSSAFRTGAKNQRQDVGSLASVEDRRSRRRRKRRDPWTMTRRKNRAVSAPAPSLDSNESQSEEIRDSEEPLSTVKESFDCVLLAKHPRLGDKIEESSQSHQKDDTNPEAAPRPVQHEPQSQTPDSPDQQSVIAMLRLDLEAQRIEKADEVRLWRDLYLEEQRRRKRLSQDLEVLQAALDSGASRKEANLQDKIESLQASLNSSLLVRRFEAPFSWDFQAKNALKISEDFNKIIVILNRVPLHQYNPAFGIDVTKVARPLELVNLLQRAFGRVGDESVIDSSVAELLRQRGLTEVLLSLVGAAICSWVLEPNAGGLFQENHLIYPKLRGLLTALDSRLASSLEFAAHEEFFDDRPMCNLVVSRRARALSRQLIACVLPLVEDHERLGEQYAQIRRGWCEKEDDLTRIFQLALNAKIRLLLTPDLYRCVFPLPGKEVKDRLMKIGLGLVPRHPDPGQKAVTRVSVIPALLRYAAAREDFTYDRFLYNAELIKNIKPDVLIQARVLV
ncbi:hypothetical protein PV08_03621 [Exophiala spinifera]|uniref:Uncharacterized protein n=1 Tax=Exophiala spinifera TaxID=91928 RepID=A0A0D2A338_9EURO|nr:uncharacterized protein PV08_03621 [Exophiala spinifera]KIW19327.1 hypothetical protein PV08_03621 [Exophiala spinifera]